MAEEHRCETEPPEAPRLCTNNCGFFGSRATDGLCSKCYRALGLAKADVSEDVGRDDVGQSSAVAAEDNVEKVEMFASGEGTKKPGRCMACNKRVGLMGFRCRCGQTFCGSHRYPEQHDCGYDFKGTAREAIAKANPVVKTSKLDKSPRGDVSYLQKFFLMYVGGRLPLHFQEDFCGTALLSTEWLRSDPRRTAIGLDLDLESLEWCLENNMNRIGADGFSRISLFHGNVLNPEEARLVQPNLEKLVGRVRLSDDTKNDPQPKISSFPLRDIVCAFNYSCCCLLTRVDLVRYFKHVLHGLSRQGGIFVMDLYGGTSSECSLKMHRRFPEFTYTWEQQEFDIVNRITRISLHFQLGKKKTLRHAFSYKWRLWSLPEVTDCMMEAGFSSVHIWMREMPDAKHDEASEDSFNPQYEEVTSFQQRDSWNAYVVATVPVSSHLPRVQLADRTAS